jgi:ribosomal protein S18 acetylase RimI-like enzyme
VTSDKAPSAFVLPAALLSQGYRLRPETEDDTVFLMQLFATTRMAELEQTPWTVDQKWAFIAQQFELQRLHYRTHYADTWFDVIEQNGVPAGRLYLQEVSGQFRIIDIVMMPEWRGKGVGTAILKALMETARAAGKDIDIFVEKFNPALAWYRRLGFEEFEDMEVYLEMRWSADSPAA